MVLVAIAIPIRAQTTGTVWFQLSDTALATAVSGECGSLSTDRDGLLRRHDLLQDLIQSGHSRGDEQTPSMLELSCLRAQMHQLGMPARPGVMLHSGETWGTGAVRVLISLVQGVDTTASTPDNDTLGAAAELLGALLLAEPASPNWSEVGPALLTLSSTRPGSRLALRGCALVSMRGRALTESSRCSQRALDAGSDSVWHTLHLARLAEEADDTALVASLFRSTLAAARSSGDWESLGWHLSWFLSPPELSEWLRLADDSRGDWIELRLAERDARDGLELGGRWYEHLRRLEVADSLFRFRTLRKDLARFTFAATPESELRPETVANYWEPGLVAARPYREYQRTHPEYDDRAHIFLRFGEPDRRIFWTARDTVSPRLGEKTVFASVNVREIWQYRTPMGNLILNFEGERFDGTNEATRLIAGALGSYTCDIDAYRCGLSHRAMNNGLPAERIEELTTTDRELVDFATRRDNAAEENALDVAISAALSRLRSPDDLSHLAVASWAIRIGDLSTSRTDADETTAFDLILRRWNNHSVGFSTDTLSKRLRIDASADRKSYLVGHASFPEVPGGTAVWSLEVLQDGTVRGRTSAVLAGRSAPALWLSDLILGSAAQGEHLTLTDGTRIDLAPLGAFDSTRPVMLYWQTLNSGEPKDVRTRISIYSDVSRPALLTVSNSTQIPAGFRHHRRELDLSQIADGSYVLRLELVAPSGETTATTQVPLLLRLQN